MNSQSPIITSPDSYYDAGPVDNTSEVSQTAVW